MKDGLLVMRTHSCSVFCFLLGKEQSGVTCTVVVTIYEADLSSYV